MNPLKVEKIGEGSQCWCHSYQTSQLFICQFPDTLGTKVKSGRNQRSVLNFPLRENNTDLTWFDKKKHVQRTQEVRTWSEAAPFSSKHRSHWNARKPTEKRRINTANNHLGKLQVFDIVESLAPFRGQKCQQRIPFLENSSSSRWIPGGGNMMNYIFGVVTTGPVDVWCATCIYLNVFKQYKEICLDIWVKWCGNFITYE